MWLADPPRVLFISAWTPHVGLPALRNAVGSVHHWHPEPKLQLFVPTRTPVAALAEMATWPDTLVVVVSHQSASAAHSAADSVAQQSTAILRGRATAAQRRGEWKRQASHRSGCAAAAAGDARSSALRL